MTACWTCSASCPSGRRRRDREPGGALHERADGGPVGPAADRVALPVAGHGPVPDLGGPFAGHDHGLAVQLAPALDVDRLVDGLRACVHVPIIGEVRVQPVAGLLGAPMPFDPGPDLVPQPRADARLARLRPFAPVRGRLLRPVRPVAARAGVAVPAHLAADGRRRTAQPTGDGTYRVAGPAPVGYQDALGLTQITRADVLGNVHGRTISVHRRFPPRPARPLRRTLPVRLDTPTMRAA